MLAVCAVPALWADAAVISALAAILATAAMQAVVNLLFTIRSSETGRAVAGVGALAGVEASPVVATRFMICTVIQILVTEEASPAFVTEAVPGLNAAAVQAPGVPLTFIT